MKPLEERRTMIDKQHTQLSMCKQCDLLELNRGGLYYTPSMESDENLAIMRLLDVQYFTTPFYGVRRLTAWLRKQGYDVNRKRVKRLMELVGWQTLYRKPNTSWKNKANAIYPYLLKGVEINKRNQVWAIDITYIPMRKGFMYLFAIIDLHTRYVINWSISNTMTAQWCKETIQQAIQTHGKPDIINSDQGSQFTSLEYIELLQSNEIKISMDGKGRAIDNIFIERLWRSVKYECVYLIAFEDGVQLYEGLKGYFNFYNNERLHQSLEYETPQSLYRIAA